MDVNIGKFYRHFKGTVYHVLDIATHTETCETMVVYQDVFGTGKTYVRPYDMFVSKVDKNKYPNSKQEYRFELIEE